MNDEPTTDAIEILKQKYEKSRKLKRAYNHQKRKTKWCYLPEFKE